MKTLPSLFLSLLLSTIFLTSFGQESRFFMPKEIQKAYENGTRSFDGKPGSKYWHNTVDYDIEVEVIPEEKRLAGSENIVYYNNSPDDLSFLVIRLYHDVFRRANPRAYRVDPEDITEGVDLIRISIEGEEVDLENPRGVSRQGTNMRVGLPKPLKSGEKVALEIDWAQRIPETTVRTGAYDSTSYFLAYWYPQVAVYDDIFGWDQLSYDFSTEFYNNLGNYDVKIKAPTNFTVLSTGVLQNADKVLQPTHFERYKKAKTAAETVKIIGDEDLETGIAHASDTWHYTAEEVADFAFCLSDHYHWDAANQEVDGRNVLVNSFYPAEIAERAAEVNPNQQKMMKHFSEDVPGIPYPYPEFSTFIASGGGGMEYPMMANNGGPGLGVTVHEMFHTYFPMYVRTNEKRYAWMDEGWADFATSFLIRRFFDEEEDTPLYSEFAAQIQGTLGSTSDLPLISSTQFMDNTNYGYASYSLPAFLYAVLYHHLGEELFLNCWREYIRRWAKNSPTPYDFMYTFENVSGQDLSWFWKPWFFNYGDVSVKIQSYKKGKLVVENTGSRPVPLSIRLKMKDGTTKDLDFSASIWKEENTFSTKFPEHKEISSVAVNYNVPDVELLDNFYPSLQEQYKSFEIAEGIMGNYPLEGYPVSVVISKKEGILHLAIPGAGLQGYLMPGTEDKFESLDGSMKVEFEQEGGTYTGLKFQLSGFQASAKKE